MARKSLAVLLVTVLIASMVAPVAAHSWQTEVEQGDFALGISSTPEQPVAGMTTEFSARIADSTPDGVDNRTDYGAVTNTEVEVHIKGPNHYHDHVKVGIPKDDAHFSFDYLFPTDGKYRITVVAQLEGQEYAFAFTRDVMLLPAEASGPEMQNLSKNVSHLSEELHSVDKNVDQTNKNVKELSSQVDSLQRQVESLKTQLQEQQNSEPVQAPGFGVIAMLLAAVGAAFVVGKRR